MYHSLDPALGPPIRGAVVPPGQHSINLHSNPPPTPIPNPRSSSFSPGVYSSSTFLAGYAVPPNALIAPQSNAPPPTAPTAPPASPALGDPNLTIPPGILVQHFRQRANQTPPYTPVDLTLLPRGPESLTADQAQIIAAAVQKYVASINPS